MSRRAYGMMWFWIGIVMCNAIHVAVALTVLT